MSPGVEASSSSDAERPTATLPQTSDGAHPAGHHPHEHHHDHHILIEPEEDRWRWRRKIREDKRKLAAYRIAVGLLGLILVVLGFISGPIPGPGGIPLILLGLAVWSSEFGVGPPADAMVQGEAASLPHRVGSQEGPVLGGLLQLLRTRRICLPGDNRHPGVAARVCEPAATAFARTLTSEGWPRRFSSRYAYP